MCGWHAHGAQVRHRRRWRLLMLMHHLIGIRGRRDPANLLLRGRCHFLPVVEPAIALEAFLVRNIIEIRRYGKDRWDGVSGGSGWSRKPPRTRMSLRCCGLWWRGTRVHLRYEEKDKIWDKRARHKVVYITWCYFTPFSLIFFVVCNFLLISRDPPKS